jgi:hypothetical protein
VEIIEDRGSDIDVRFVYIDDLSVEDCRLGTLESLLARFLPGSPPFVRLRIAQYRIC